MRMIGHQLPCAVSSLFKKALNHGGLVHKIYMRKNAVSGRKNTTMSMVIIAIDSKIRDLILISCSHISYMSPSSFKLDNDWWPILVIFVNAWVR